MSAKPSLKSQQLNDSNLMQYAEQIITRMRAADDVFANPVPTLANVEAALINFRQSATDAVHKDQRAIRIRKEKRQVLEYQLSELAKYVDTIAFGNDAIILTSGFALPKQAESFAGHAPKATGLTAEPQQVGSSRIKLHVEKWRGARMYEYQFRKKGSEDSWTSKLDSKSTCIIEGLEKFQEYEFRATYIGINPEPAYSDIVASYVV